MKIIAVLVSIVLFASCAYAAEVGKITYAEGRVDILSAGSEKGAPARDGVAINVGDSIRTKSNSKAEVRFFDNTVMRVAQNSKVDIVDYQLDASNMRRSAEIKLERGKVRTIISKMKDAAEFRIDTPNAKGTVKGSDVFTSFQAGNSSMLVTEGTLSVFNPAYPKDVISVPAGNAVLVPLEGLPKGPRRYLEMEEKFNAQDTDIPETIASRKGAAVIRGTIAKFTGDVQVMTKGSTQSHAAKQGEIVNEGDKIVTGANGIVEISFDNGSALYLKANTDITILKLVMDSKTGEFENLFQADKGDVKARIEGLKGKSKFEVKTPTAICGARGTIMLIHIDIGGATNSFFEGGNGYTTNLVSGNTLDVNAGSGANTDGGGGVTGSGPLSDEERAGMGDGFDPNGGTGDTGGTDGEGMSDLGGGGTTGGVSNFVDTADNTETDTVDTDVVDVPITEADSSILDQDEEVQHVTQVGDFFYSALDTNNKPYLVKEAGAAMYDFGMDSDYDGDSNNFSLVWAATNEISAATVDIIGNYDSGGSSSQYHIWTTDDLFSWNGTTHTTSDAGAFYCVMGGTIDTASYGSIKTLVIGLYIDASGNAGVFFGDAEGLNDEAFMLDGTGSFWVDRVYDYENNMLDGVVQSPTPLTKFIIDPMDLYTHIGNKNNLTGEGYTDLGSGGTQEITIKLVDGFGTGFQYDVTNDSEFGIWGARFAGSYKDSYPAILGYSVPISMPIAGKSIEDGVMNGVWMQTLSIDTWTPADITGTLEGFHISLDDDGIVRAGRLTNGRALGNYVEVDAPNTGTWQAVACGEWVEESQLYSGNSMQTLIDAIDAAPGGFDGLNPNILVTATTVNMNFTSLTNNITSVAMDMRFLEDVNLPGSNNGIWAATVSGVYAGAPILNTEIGLSGGVGGTGSAKLVFTQWDGATGGNWRANVTNGTTGDSRNFSGIAIGTIVDSSNFNGAAVGTWEKDGLSAPPT